MAAAILALLVLPLHSVPFDTLLIWHMVLPRVRLVNAVRIVPVPVSRAPHSGSGPAGTPCVYQHPLALCVSANSRHVDLQVRAGSLQLQVNVAGCAFAP